MAELSGMGAITAEYVAELTKLNEKAPDEKLEAYVGTLTTLLAEVEQAEPTPAEEITPVNP